MKVALVGIVLLPIVLLPLTACGSADETPNRSPAVSANGEENPYLAAAEARFQELAEEATLVKDELAVRPDAVSEELDELLATIDEKRKDAIDQMIALRDSSLNDWESAGEKVGETLDDLEDAIDEALERLRA